MADISITPVAPRVFRDEVREGQGATTHQVTVPERIDETLELREDDLEREPATSILRQFSLSDISRYFPEYPSELERRLS